MTSRELAKQFIEQTNNLSINEQREERLLDTIESQIDAAIAAAVEAENEACAWHEQQAINFYTQRIFWCNSHPGNDQARIISEYTKQSHEGVLAAIRARREAQHG